MNPAHAITRFFSMNEVSSAKPNINVVESTADASSSTSKPASKDRPAPIIPPTVQPVAAARPRKQRRCLSRKRLTLFELLSLILAIIGLGSLWFLWEEGHRQAKALENSARQTIINQPMEVDKLFVQNPDLIKYFYHSQPIGPNDANYDRAVVTADFVLDSFDAFFSEGQYLPELQKDTPSWRSWAAYIHGMYSRSPILRQRLDEVKDWYAPDFVTFMKEQTD